MNNWLVRLGVVAGLTYAAHRFLPLGAVGKTVVLAIGGVSGSLIVAQNVPLVGQALNGQLPVSLPASSSAA